MRVNPRGLVFDITEAGNNNINIEQQTNSKLCLQPKKKQKNAKGTVNATCMPNLCIAREAKLGCWCPSGLTHRLFTGRFRP